MCPFLSEGDICWAQYIRLCIPGIEAQRPVYYFSPRPYFFCSLSRASWLRIHRNDFYACCLRRYLHGPQSCFPSSETRCTLILMSSGPLENLLLQENGENMLLRGLYLYNYNQICDVLQIKTMTERYDDRSPQTIPLKLPQHLQQLSL